MSTRQRLLLWSFALLGLGASSASAWVHYRLLDDPTYTRFCDVSSTVNCTDPPRAAVRQARVGPIQDGRQWRTWEIRFQQGM